MDFEKIVSAMTNEEIRAAIDVFYEEQQRRKRVQCQKLIDNFRNAFSELRKAGIVPKYYDEPDGCCTTILVEDWDGFEFD